MLIPISRELTCILCLSLSFMILFSSDGTMQNMQKIIISSISDDRADFEVEGYTVTGVLYTVFSVSLWFGPYVNNAIGPKFTMFFASIGYLGVTVPSLIENEWAIYGGTVICGIAAGCLWPAEGHYMIENSSPETTARNVGIFWSIMKTSTLWGNLFVYYKFHGKQYIDRTTRETVLYFLVAINILAVASFLVLPSSTSDHKTEGYSPSKTVKKCWSILTSRNMFWLFFTFSYTGLQQAFTDGIYSPSIGFTLAFGNSAKELVALSGIVLSIGGILGAIAPVVLSKWIRRHGYARRSIVLIGCTGQLLAYLITFINLPDTAVFGNTDQLSLITPSATLALTGSLLLSFGDSCLNTQIYSIIADLYRENSAEAIAYYKFVKAVLVATSFYWCSHVGLHTQVVILSTYAVVGVFCFFVADSDITNSRTHPTKKDTQSKQ
ncbi:UNC93-like protein MFSD11 [Homalodisca vitripennis]|uniref:UNC93-like protein MFSD11 n=1 Tax=Homalodisca vitripennis TaxID=197043 RepID=UPI001EEACFC6|nr:UNC93-like protein MFSD11 [Homalodisca vitripennis]XP_046675880.1 UNC93-like protein MFSD11 [Homalodisca vitripennis]